VPLCLLDLTTNFIFLDETDELVIPGDKKEINDFIEFASKQSRIHVDLVLPKATLSVPSKHFYELLYNRYDPFLLC
jgi:hypothetical protein